jgi:hypothetical protein
MSQMSVVQCHKRQLCSVSRTANTIRQKLKPLQQQQQQQQQMSVVQRHKISHSVTCQCPERASRVNPMRAPSTSCELFSWDEFHRKGRRFDESMLPAGK